MMLMYASLKHDETWQSDATNLDALATPQQAMH